MESLGQYLKKERERRGIKIQEIAKETHISSTFLEALENEQFDDLPGEVFVRGFLRGYATYVGLDPQEIMTWYSKVRGPVPSTPTKTKTFSIGGNYFVVKFYLTLLVFLALMGYGGYQVFLYIFYPTTEKSEEPSKYIYGSEYSGSTSPSSSYTPFGATEKTPSGSDSQSTPEGDEVTQPESGEPYSAEPEGNATDGAESADVVPSSHRLSITASQDTWISVTVDGKVTQDMVLKKGKTFEWTSGKTFDITTGNVQGTQVEFDGKPVRLPETTTNVVKNFILPQPAPETGTSG